MLRYRALLTLSHLAAYLPRGVTYLVAGLAGELAYLLNGPARRVSQDNIRHVLGAAATPRTVRAAARGCFRAAARYYADLGRTPLMDPVRFSRENLHDHDFENVVRAYDQGKGVIVASIHYGNPEYVAQAMSGRGYHFLALIEPLEPQPLADLFQRLRSSQGQTFVEVGWSGIKAALKHLKAGGAVCIMCDRDIQRSGEPVPFFGATARIPSGAIDLARHTGAPIVPVVSRRISQDQFELFVEPPLELVRTGRVEEDRRENTARLIERFEKYLRRDPSQWFVLEQRIWPRDAVAAPSPNPSTAAR